MHPEVKKLLEVQKVDRKIARLRKEVQSLPREEAKRSSRLEELKTVAAAATEQRQAAELRNRDLDLVIRQTDAEIQNLEGKLNVIKNNAEYQAILFQIEAVKKERDKYEEELLALLEKVPGLEDATNSATAALAEDEKVFVEFKAEASKVLAAQEEEVLKVSHGRDDLLDGISLELVDEYERLFTVRDGQAICGVEAQFCQGCYSKITVNDVAKLRGKSLVVRCGSCQRVLYLPE